MNVMTWSKIALGALFTTSGLFATWVVTHRIGTERKTRRRQLTINKEYEWNDINEHVLKPYMRYIINAAAKCEVHSRTFSFPDFTQFNDVESRVSDFSIPFAKAIHIICNPERASDYYDDESASRILQLIEDNACLKRIYKHIPSARNTCIYNIFTPPYEKEILLGTYIFMIDKTSSFRLTFLTILQPMFKSLSRFGKGHANINMYCIRFQLNINEVDGVVGFDGGFQIDQIIARCLITKKQAAVNNTNKRDRVERDIFIVSVPRHVFAVVYEQYANKETLYSLDNLDDEDYEKQYNVKEMHKQVLLKFRLFFRQAVVGIQVGDKTQYNICFTDGIVYEKYCLDCTYIMYRHCILLHILPPVEQFIQHVLPPGPDSVAAVARPVSLVDYDEKIHDKYRQIFAQIWISLMALYNNARERGGFLICPNQFYACISWDSLFEINEKTGEVTRWRYNENFQFAEVLDEDDTGIKEPLEICTVQANMESDAHFCIKQSAAMS